MSKVGGVNYGGVWRRVLYVVFLGQVASFSMALMSFNSSLSTNLGVNAPYTLAFFSYLALTLVFGSDKLPKESQKSFEIWFLPIGVFKKFLIDIMSSTISRVGVSYRGLWRMLYAVLMGQLTSFSMALMCFSSSLSANLGVNAPFSLSFFAYLGMTLVFGSILLYRRQKPHISWYWYVLLAFVDVQGSYLVNKSYQFSSVTSVTLLDCTTVVWVILLTWLFLGTKYSIWQFFGAALCVSGLCLVLLSDSGVGGGGGSNPILGDALVIFATCFFSFSNVGEEFCVKKVGQIEVITMFGLFGMLLSIVEMAVFERKSLESVSWSPQVILTFAGYGVAGFMYYSLTPLVLQASGATLFNLSLLTADMWAVVIRVFLYHQKVDWLYYISFLLVGIGLVIYSKPEKHNHELPELEKDETDQLNRLLPKEAV
ncbi:hypothetical protein OSB04_029221 [Centaurea solstitialis]|uniref:Uncharacterized protein n=1 Tax=Centaurea solstitialis TaxID=347529 RepID=A0AA38SH98_9ASTR|nr:hypothetical protein OSB04_029221 [Centaurea solstitialis]